MTVTIIVPTLNEIKGMQQIMPRIKPEWYDQLIVLDGHSVDGTVEWCQSQGYEVFTQQKVGMWNAYKELFQSGNVNGDIVVTFSPDGNSIPELIPLLVSKMDGDYDMVIASRYKDAAKSYDDTVITSFGNHLLNWMVNVLSSGHYTDSLVMFRAYKRDVVEKLGFMDATPAFYRQMLKMSTLFSFEPCLSLRAAREKLKVCEIPGDEPPNITLDGKRRENWLVHGVIIVSQILYDALFYHRRRWYA